MADPGTALGATSFAFLLVGKCVQGFILLSSANNIGKIGRELICFLNIEEARLVDWAQRCGLLSKPSSLDPRLNEKLINIILGQLDELLGDIDELSARYNFKLTANQTNESSSKEFSTHSDPIEAMVSGGMRRDILFRANLIKDQNILPKRLWWAGVDVKKFKELLSKIQALVQGLWNLLDPLVQDDMMRKMDQILEHRIYRSRDVEEAKELRDAIALNSDNSTRDMPLVDVAGLRSTRLEVGDLSDEPANKARQVRMAVSKDSMLDFDKVTNFVGIAGSDAMGTAKYDGKDCFAEFRTTPWEADARSIIIKRAKNLARFLLVRKSPAFRSLQCFGVAIAVDELKLYFLFELPKSGNRPVSLLTMLRSRKYPLPSVDARIRLAERLLLAMRYIHAAGWLHRNIRSEIILFFTNAENQKSFELTNDSFPYVAGFAYARLDVVGYSEDGRTLEAPKDIYRHPTWLEDERKRSQPFMDIYSMGLVILEVAAWRPLSELVKTIVQVDGERVSKADVQRVAAYIRERSTKKNDSIYLPYKMGSTYAGVVWQCLHVEQAEMEYTLSLLEGAADSLRKCVV